MVKPTNRNLLELSEIISTSFNKVLNVLSKQMFTEKLTYPQFIALEILYRHGPVLLKKIAIESMVTGANITCVIDNLEKEEYVNRIFSKEDRRVILAELTQKGKEKIESILPQYEKQLVTILSVLSENEQKTLIKLLSKLLNEK
jgi:MarR family 2-MHQ and catechol resistance regulon transcriptional repressor